MNKKNKIAIAAVAIVVPVSILGYVLMQMPSVHSSPTHLDLQQAADVQIQKSSLALLDDFSSPINVTSSADGYAWTPNIAIDPTSGGMYVAYEEQNAGATNLFVKKSDDGGKTFSNPVRVNDKSGDVFLDGRVPPNIKVGTNGEIYVLWVRSDPAPKLFMKALRGLDFAVSKDGGKTFSPAVVIDGDEPPADRSFSALDVSPDGKIYVGWLESPAKKLDNGTIVGDSSIDPTVRFTSSLDDGRTFAHSVVVDKNQCECCNVFLTSDSHNNVYVSWRKKFDVPSGMTPDNRTGMSSMSGMSMTLTIRDIVVAHSTDGGKSFSAPVRVHADNFEWNTCLHVGAPMALDSKGVLHIAWYTGKEGFAGVHYTTSTDQGNTFGKPVDLLTGDWVPPSRISLTVDDKDNTWITWEDSTGLAANTVHWKYEDTKARIELAMITPDGQVFKRADPLNQIDGKSPLVTNEKGMVAVIWGNTAGAISCSVLSV